MLFSPVFFCFFLFFYCFPPFSVFFWFPGGGETGSGPVDDVTTLILNSYDERVCAAVQHAFDIFDVNNKNEILAVELERVLCSLGQAASMDDITDLIVEIDRKNTGNLEFNAFVTHVIPYLRAGYKKSTHLSLNQLKLRFDRLDLNCDGTLNQFEFRHVVNFSNHSSTYLSVEESNQIVEYLDVDKDETISWDEFRNILKAFNDDKFMAKLPPAVSCALRKVMK